MNQQLPAKTSSPATQKRTPRTAEEQEQWELSGEASPGLQYLPKPLPRDKIPPEIAHWIRTGETSSPVAKKRIPRTAEEQEQWELSGGANTKGLLGLPQGGRPDWSKEPPHIQKWAKEQGLM